MKDREFLLEMIREYRKFGDLDNPEYEDTDRIYNAIENQLNKVKELEKIEQEHKEINGKLRERVKELEEENRILKGQNEHQYDLGWKSCEIESIPKSKIKEKIEELIKEADYRTDDNPKGRVHFTKEPCDYQIQVLQELLEV